jgi:hypothetical protein
MEDETVSTHPKFNGRQRFSNGAIPGPLQNDETNPILRPKAE